MQNAAKWLGRWLVLLLLLHTPFFGQVRAQETPTPLSNRAEYWDLGLSLNYPATWQPVVIAGQMLLGQDPEAMAGQTLTGPIVALRIVDPLRDLGLPKDATFEQIAVALNLTGRRLDVPATGSTTVAGLPAGYVDVFDPDLNLTGQTIAFRMPDGRVGALISLTPTDRWADFAPVFDAMRASAALLHPRQFRLPDLPAANAGGTPGNSTSGDLRQGSFPQGGLRYTLPAGWVEIDLGSNARVYYDPAALVYTDASGFVNGPQMIVLANPLPADLPIRAGLAQVTGLSPTETERIAETQVGGRPAVQYDLTDAATGQAIRFVAVASADSRTLITFRLTRPGILIEAAQPIFDAVLGSVQFGTALVTLVPRQPTATPLALPTPRQ